MTELFLYDMISDPILASFGIGVSAKQIALVLNEIPKSEEILVRINSPGGVADQAIAIHSLLSERPVTTRVEGSAASAATIVMMAGKKIEMTDLSQIFIHQATVTAMGLTEADLNMYSDMLKKVNNQIAGIYASRGGATKDEFLKMMKPGKSLDPESALELKLVDMVIGTSVDDVDAELDDFAGISNRMTNEYAKLVRKIVSHSNFVGDKQTDHSKRILQKHDPPDIERMKADYERLFGSVGSGEK